MTLGSARQQYFERNGLAADGGYSQRWVKYKIGPFPVGILNVKSRVRAVKLHDLHHVLTGYEADLPGEMEIGAWEIGSGCRDYYAAWVLNVGAFALGLVMTPRVVYRAFVRGRHTSNLYVKDFEESLLSKPVDEARRELSLDSPPLPARGVDNAVFATWTVFAGVLWLTPFAALAALIAKAVGYF